MVSPSISPKTRDILTTYLLFDSVVFSFWVTTLNLVEQGLRDRGIGYIRFDGKVSGPRRTKALKDFREDASVRVALLTISCGAVG